MKHLSFSAAFLSFLLSAGAAHATWSVNDLPPFAPGGGVDIAGISGDGLTITGSAFNANGDALPAIWVNGVLQILPSLPSAANSYDSVAAATPNGSILVGKAVNGFGNDAPVYWSGGNIYALPYLLNATYEQGSASDISNDGTIIVGVSMDSNNHNQAVRWVNGAVQGLGFLSTAVQSDSIAKGISGNGNVIVGNSINAAGANQAVKWVNGSITGLDFLPGSSAMAQATGVNDDGSVIIGLGLNSSGNIEAISWNNSNVAQGLGFLPGAAMQTSAALAVNGSGNVIVGLAYDSNSAPQAVRWVNGGTAESIADILTAQNVDLTGWRLIQAKGVDNSGNIIVGTGTSNSQTIGFIANVETGGVTTPVDLGQSLGSVAQVSQQTAAVTSVQLGQSLFQARSLMPVNTLTASSMGSSARDMNTLSTAAGGPYRHLWEFYATGGFGIGQGNDFSNNDLNGTVGVRRHITSEFALGGGVIGSTARSDLVFDGNSKVNALGLSGIAAYAPMNSNLRLYGSVFAADLNMDITRGYTNGAALDSSRGSTDGFAYGAAGQLGWSVPVTQRYNVMPYADLRWSKTKVDGYSETGGAFAASFTSQDVDNLTSRLGIENNYLLMPNLNLMGRVALGHRFTDDAGGIVANVSGLTQNLNGDLGDRSWGEAAIGLGWQVNEGTYVSGEINGRSGNTPEPAMNVIAGLAIKF